MAEDGAYRTDNMGLATVLVLNGHQYQLAKLTDRKAIWVFTPASEHEEEFDDLIYDWEGFALKVEPRQFLLKFAEMRSELFALINSRPVAPTSA